MASIVALALFVASLSTGQSTEPNRFEPKPPASVVEQLWAMGARGDLLTEDGRSRAAAFFTESGSPLEVGTIRVFSNYYGVNRNSIEGDAGRDGVH